ncbi:MAG: PH domain-containing protein [Phycisphaerales bacterium]
MTDSPPTPHTPTHSPTPASPSSAQRPKDRAELAGFPPDHGPEQNVMLVHPSIWRGKPFSSLALWIAPVLIAGLARFVMFKDMSWGATGITFLVVAVLAWGFFLWEWLFFSLARSLKVTNKRVLERTGLLSRRSSEVLHEHIRSVAVDQTLLQRIFNLGTLAISSSASDANEIHMKDVPQPHKVKEVIDLYRDQLA